MLAVRDDGVESPPKVADRSSFFAWRPEPDRVTFHLSISFLLRLCVGLEGVAEGEQVRVLACEVRCVRGGGERMLRPSLPALRCPALETATIDDIKVAGDVRCARGQGEGRWP